MAKFIKLTRVLRNSFSDYAVESELVVNVDRIDYYEDDGVIGVNGQTFLVKETAPEIWQKIERALDNQPSL